jgi:hypothetical protein
MSEQPAQPTETETKDFMERLAEFRNGLPEDEQALMDALVARATAGDQEQQAEQGAADGEQDVSKQELDDFFAKLQDYRDKLPEGDQRLMDDVVVAAGAVDVEPDVEAHGDLKSLGMPQGMHRIHWIRTGPISQRSTYVAACDQGTGSNPFRLDAIAIPFTAQAVYTCNTWDQWG